MSNSKVNKIPVLSFYSGGGFMDMGFEMAGFEIVWTNEFDETFIKLHSAGITSWRKSKGNGIKAEIFNKKSITEVLSTDIINEAFPDGIPKHFGIIGGPPCQDFSMNGNLEGFEGERGKLTTLFFDKILELRPTFFVMENVTGLIKGKSHKEHLEKLLQSVQHQYHIDHNTLNALEFGVPQSRERVFFIGIRKDKINEKHIKINLSGNWFKWPVNRKYTNALTKYNWPKAVPFGGQLIKPDEIPLELCVESCLVSQRELKSLPNAKEFFNLYLEETRLKAIKEGETNRPSFKRLHRFKYSPTTCYGNNEVHLHPYKHRRLSVRETLRIQGVPDTYILPSELPLSKKFKMIGNGVPVPLAKAVAVSLKNFMKRKKVFQLKKMDIWSKEKRSEVMGKIRGENTKPEKVLRSALFRIGFRFRIHAKELPGKPDIILPKYKTAIFVHGCFWHYHKECREGRIPSTNSKFWKEKLERNIERDRKNIENLKNLGWNVIVVWECGIEKSMEMVITELISTMKVNKVDITKIK